MAIAVAAVIAVAAMVALAVALDSHRPGAVETSPAETSPAEHESTSIREADAALMEQLESLSRCLELADHRVHLPDDLGPVVPGFGGASEPPPADSAGCVVSATSSGSPGRHLTFGLGSSPFGIGNAQVLPNGARRGEIEDGFAAEVTRDGTTMFVLGYGVTLAEFDGVAGSL